ncbi:MAG: malate:quinone oxidoreductase, partial [Methylotenera sp.]|nr:malate:quinone oxidoreductase [Flavobacterium sp.]
GASTAVSIMVDLIGRCFKEQFETPEWQEKLKMMIPSHGQKLNDNPILLEEVRKETAAILKLNN